MTKEEFIAKYNLTEEDYDALIEYEIVRESGDMNMWVYMMAMMNEEVPGNKELVTKIIKYGFYNDFLDSLDD